MVRRYREVAVLCLLVAWLAGCGQGPSTTSSTAQPLDQRRLTVMSPNSGSAVVISGNLIDNGGLILPFETTIAIWWGQPSNFSSDTQAGIDALFMGLEGSRYLGIADEYMRGGTAVTSFGGDLFDASAPPSNPPPPSKVEKEICDVLTARGVAPSPTTLYFVYTDNFPVQYSYCAWHTFGKCGQTNIHYAYVPNSAGYPGCDPGYVTPLSCNGYSEGTRAMANSSAHEFMEMVTDPEGDAWLFAGGYEVADKCSWHFVSCVDLAPGRWQLQEEWSNAATSCVQQ